MVFWIFLRLHHHHINIMLYSYSISVSLLRNFVHVVFGALAKKQKQKKLISITVKKKININKIDLTYSVHLRNLTMPCIFRSNTSWPRKTFIHSITKMCTTTINTFQLQHNQKPFTRSWARVACDYNKSKAFWIFPSVCAPLGNPDAMDEQEIGLLDSIENWAMPWNLAE